jgi:putative FmdB family regulatory protein
VPTYDYRCDACGHAFERFQSISEKVLRTCPACRKRKLVRLVGAGAGFILKGTGWYATDYRKSPPPAEKPATSDGDAKGGGCAKPECGTTPGTCASSDGTKDE